MAEMPMMPIRLRKAPLGSDHPQITQITQISNARQLGNLLRRKQGLC